MCVCSGVDYSTPWRESFEAAREALEYNLHITQPVMQTILLLWDKHRDSTLIDLSSIRYTPLQLASELNKDIVASL